MASSCTLASSEPKNQLALQIVSRVSILYRQTRTPPSEAGLQSSDGDLLAVLLCVGSEMMTHGVGRRDAGFAYVYIAHWAKASVTTGEPTCQSGRIAG
jgi:hypothetical protein